MKTFRYIGNGSDKIHELIAQKGCFEVTTTSRTTKIKTANINYLFAHTHYYGRIFGLLSQLKKMLNDNEQKILDAPFSGKPENVKYFMFSESQQNFKVDAGTIYDIPNIVEADISMAYYRTAYNLGFITKEFYERCKTLDKKDRLVLIGSIATVKCNEVYNNGLKISSEINKNELHRMAWFKICSYVDSVLITIKERLDKINPDIFLFYWVDGVYFRDFKMKGYSWQTLFKEISEIYPFDWKYKRVERMRVLNYGESLKIQLQKQGENKTFFYPKRDMKLYYLDKDGKPVDIDGAEILQSDKIKF